MNKIIVAKEYARRAHKDQVRKYSGLPYIIHPFRVAAHVLDLPTATEEMVCAAYLHDVIEDTWVEECDLIFSFGTPISDLVVGLNSRSKQLNSTENRKMRKIIDRDYLACQSDEVKTIKLIDRYDNLCDIGNELEGVVDSGWLQKYLMESRDLLYVIRTGNKYWGDKLETLINEMCD